MIWTARMTIAAALVGCAVFAYLVWDYWRRPAPPPVETSIPLPEAPQAEPVPKERIIVRTVTVYRDRPVPLPGAATTEAVTATARLEAEERPYTLTATLDTATGDSRIWAQAEPLPILSLSTRGEAGIAYGTKGGAPTIRLHARQDVLQIKSARASVLASVDSDGDWFAGIGVRLAW